MLRKAYFWLQRFAFISFPLLKILALKFKLLGDVAVLVPALRALRAQWPAAELHVLVREEAVPVLQNLPWIQGVWGIARSLKGPRLKAAWDTLQRLRRMRFDRSIDFEGNDRGALLSLVIGARERLGSIAPRGFFGRRYCYNQWVEKAPNGIHEILRDLHTLTVWNVPAPASLEHETRADPALAAQAALIFPEKRPVLAHLSTSQEKKEWPVTHWVELAGRARKQGIPLVFSSGVGAREKELLRELRRRCPEARTLEAVPTLTSFIAVIERAAVFISGDTGPLHLAAGLKVPVVGIFGPSNMEQWLPFGPRCIGLKGPPCVCDGHARRCEQQQSCMASVSVDRVWQQLLALYDAA